MKIMFDNKEFEMNDKEIKASAKLVYGFVDKIRDAYPPDKYYTFIFTFLCTMYLVSADLVCNMDRNAIRKAMKMAEDLRRAQAEKEKAKQLAERAKRQ